MANKHQHQLHALLDDVRDMAPRKDPIHTIADILQQHGLNDHLVGICRQGWAELALVSLQQMMLFGEQAGQSREESIARSIDMLEHVFQRARSRASKPATVST
jgi:hypothetical protein